MREEQLITHWVSPTKKYVQLLRIRNKTYFAYRRPIRRRVLTNSLGGLAGCALDFGGCGVPINILISSWNRLGLP